METPDNKTIPLKGTALDPEISEGPSGQVSNPQKPDEAQSVRPPFEFDDEPLQSEQKSQSEGLSESDRFRRALDYEIGLTFLNEFTHQEAVIYYKGGQPQMIDFSFSKVDPIFAARVVQVMQQNTFGGLGAQQRSY